MQIGIVGLGLIGGSLGLDLRSRGHSIYGISRNPQTCERAVERGAVDQASPDLEFFAQTKPDLIFICTPLGAVAATVAQLIPHLNPTTILTDVGSVKTAMVEAIAPLWPNFVGGHPMAGTAETGIEAAQSDLFVGKPYVLTPTPTTPPTAVQVVTELVQSLGCQIYQCSPQAHDRAVAWISHLPVMVSASLIAACGQEEEPEILRLAQQLASSGFRDTSRVGGGNPELGRMMAEYNREALLKSLLTYRQVLDRLMAQIEQQHWTDLEQQLEYTQQLRPPFLK